MSSRDDEAPTGVDQVGGSPRLAVSATVGRQFFRDRLTSQYAHHYHLIVSIFKGVALSSAALSFLAIVGSSEAPRVKVAALGLWIAGLAAIIATYNGIMVVSIMVNTPPNVVDLVTPFIMGLAEFMQFAVLMPLSTDVSSGQPTTAAQLRHLTWWPLIFAVLMVSACAGISNSKTQMSRTAEGAPRDIRPLLDWYVGSLTQSQLSTAITSAVMAAAFVGLRYGPHALRQWQGVVAVIGLFGMVNGIMATERVRKMIFTSVGAGTRVDAKPVPPSSDHGAASTPGSAE